MKKGYYCEACGVAVKVGAESCPHCGRSFLGVRCPRCGREGAGEEFVHGCVECGYMNESPGSAGTDKFTDGHTRRPSHWPASRYWVLSGLLLVILTLSVFFWLNG